MYRQQKRLKSSTNDINDFDEKNNVCRDLSKSSLNRVVDTTTFLEAKTTSIWDTLLHYQRQNKHSLQTNKSNDSINIVGVVLSSSILDLSRQTIELLISDPTIPLRSCVKVVLRGTSAVSCIMNGKVVVGDIVGINSLTLEKDYYFNQMIIDDGDEQGRRVHFGSADKGNTEKRRCTNTAAPSDTPTRFSKEPIKINNHRQERPRVLCELRYNYMNCSNVSVSCFCGTYSKSSKQFQSFYSGSTTQIKTVSTFGCSVDYISSLLNWYQSHFVDDLEYFMSSRSSNISPITSCQKRQLREISSFNILSNIVVRIISCRGGIARSLSRNNRTNTSSSEIPCALLCDGNTEEDMMPLTILSNNCSSGKDGIPKVLHSALKERSTVFITKVLSQNHDCPSNNKSGVDSDGFRQVVLVTTEKTTFTVISDECNHQSINNAISSRSQMFIDGEFMDMSVPDSIAGLCSQSQLVYSSKGHQSLNDELCVEVQANILDIKFEGVDLSLLSQMKATDDSTTGLVDWENIITCVPSLTSNNSLNLNRSSLPFKALNYRSAVLTLCTKSSRHTPLSALSSPCLPTDKPILVKVNASVMKVICGDLLPSDYIIILGSNDDNSIKCGGNNNNGNDNNRQIKFGSNPKICGFVSGLLTGLIREDIMLLWTLKKSPEECNLSKQSSWNALDVVLPHF